MEAIVSLRGKEEMLVHLQNSTKLSTALGNTIFPVLLARAGQKVKISEIPNVFATAFSAHLERGRTDIAGGIYGELTKYATAIVADRHMHADVVRELEGAMQTGKIWR